MTSASARTARLASSQRTPSAMSCRRWVSTLWRTPPGAVPIRETSTTPRATQTVCTRNGHTIALANRSAPNAGPTSWLRVMKPVWMRTLAMPRSAFATSIGVRVIVAVSANTSAVASAKSATSTSQMLTWPVTTTVPSTVRTRTRTPSMAITSTRRSRRSASAPPNRPKSSHGSCSITAEAATRTGFRVCEATRRGPAASIRPSPRLVVRSSPPANGSRCRASPASGSRRDVSQACGPRVARDVLQAGFRRAASGRSPPPSSR